MTFSLPKTPRKKFFRPPKFQHKKFAINVSLFGQTIVAHIMGLGNQSESWKFTKYIYIYNPIIALDERERSLETSGNKIKASCTFQLMTRGEGTHIPRSLLLLKEKRNNRILSITWTLILTLCQGDDVCPHELILGKLEFYCHAFCFILLRHVKIEQKEMIAHLIFEFSCAGPKEQSPG